MVWDLHNLAERRESYGSFLFVSLVEGDQEWVRGGGEEEKILEEDLLKALRRFLGAGGQVGDQKQIRQGAGRPSVVLGPERPTHFRHNNK